MKGVLEKLANNSQTAIKDGVYDIRYANTKSQKNLVDVIKNNKHASLITEVKFSSPSLGNIREISDPVQIARQMVDGGASALSVLTQPYLFNGSPEYFTKVRKGVTIPLLMKDIVVDKIQIDAAQKLGADVVLLIQAIFDNKFAKDIDEFVSYAHKKNLLVLLESHTRQEFADSTKTSADILGINNRNLDTLEIDLATTQSILKDRNEKRIIVSESGIESPKDIQFLKKCGADAFLVGSSIMKSRDIKGLVSELVLAI
ncbi:Indole-3-glycerol phosphate synthase [Nitrosotalea sinensis]|uniref:indole-3-glycerol-phosphate synthase n=1 Tax=Nitrosotalea sinensis TaxID=1499975 RepID=A0A2H1EHG4_9ARCH|nr:indole-3-glycerol-phosphate synthase [Candidatus Nitrosotalea sinensis]SHO46442.1 Indole-3-glycerol phosphate synthase [Candidatus Nitrosotalea sinensis]